MFFLHPTEPFHREKVEISTNSKKNFHPAHDAKPKQKSARITFVQDGHRHTCTLPHTSKNGWLLPLIPPSSFNSITSSTIIIHSPKLYMTDPTLYRYLPSALLMLPRTRPHVLDDLTTSLKWLIITLLPLHPLCCGAWPQHHHFLPATPSTLPPCPPTNTPPPTPLAAGSHQTA